MASENAATVLLNSLWFRRQPEDFPVDPVVIARRLGVNVYLADMANNLSGVLAKLTPEGDTDMYLNRGHALVRRRFTAGHELGHLDTVDLIKNPAATFFFRRDDRSSCGTEQEEIYANQFAAALLMPENEVRRLVQLGYNDTELLDYFKVSEPALGHRFANLRLR